jgi:hypothetical protein
LLTRLTCGLSCDRTRTFLPTEAGGGAASPRRFDQRVVGPTTRTTYEAGYTARPALSRTLFMELPSLANLRGTHRRFTDASRRCAPRRFTHSGLHAFSATELAGQPVRCGSEQVRSPRRPVRAPRSTALRPSNLAPGTVPRITPRCGLSDRAGNADSCEPALHRANRIRRVPGPAKLRCNPDILTRLVRKTSRRCPSRSSSWKALPAIRFFSQSRRSAIGFDRSTPAS